MSDQRKLVLELLNQSADIGIVELDDTASPEMSKLQNGTAQKFVLS